MGTGFLTGEAKFNTTVLGGVAAVLFSANDIPFRPLADGMPDPGFFGILESRPRIGLSTYDIKAALSYASLDGTALSGAGFTAPWRPVAKDGIRTAANSYLLTVPAGMVLPRRLSVSQGSNAQIDLEIIACNTSGTIPFTFASSSTSLFAPTQDVAYTLGPVYLNGSQLTDVQGIDIDFGIREWVTGGDGLPFPKSCGVIERLPIIQVRTLDPSIGATLLAGGYVATQFDVYLRRLIQGGGGTDSGSNSTHLKIACNVGGAHSLGMGARMSETGFTLEPYYASSTAQMILTADQALP